jgi:hypothetical protein
MKTDMTKIHVEYCYECDAYRPSSQFPDGATLPDDDVGLPCADHLRIGREVKRLRARIDELFNESAMLQRRAVSIEINGRTERLVPDREEHE